MRGSYYMNISHTIAVFVLPQENKLLGTCFRLLYILIGSYNSL